MLIVLSPAKSLDFESPVPEVMATQPQFVPQAKVLVDSLKTLKPNELAQLMSISDTLATLNTMRFAQWKPHFNEHNSRPALFAFNGDVYEGLNAKTLKPQDYQFAQHHLRILSGLYGLLRPLDFMQPYRLEMGTKLKNPAGTTLYAYWKALITLSLNETLAEQSEPLLINLASEEYFKSVDVSQLNAPVVQVMFQECEGDYCRVIALFAKKARGLMARFIIENKISKRKDLQSFEGMDYRFDSKASDDKTLVFRRPKP